MKKLITVLSLLHVTFLGYSQEVIWSNDFSNCNDWLLGNAYDEGFTQYDPDINFSCDGPGPAENGVPSFLSTTSSNGFMSVISENTDGTDLSGPIENCWFQTAQPIDITGFDDISLRFQTHYTKVGLAVYQGPNSPRLLVEISTDGITWPDIQSTAISEAAEGYRFHLWPEYTTPPFIVTNPREEVFILSSVASQVDVNQIWLRFRWVGSVNMNWKIDDVEIRSTPQQDLAIKNAWVTDIFDAYEYSIVPSGFGNATHPAHLMAAVRNYSNAEQMATVSVVIDEQTYMGSRMIPAGAIDTVHITNVVYPESLGIYEVNFSLPEDDDLNGNVFTKDLEISSSVFRQTYNYNLMEISLDAMSNLAAFAHYGLFLSNPSSSQYTCEGLSVLFGPNTEIGAQVMIELFDVETTNLLTASSQAVTITSEMYDQILSGQYLFIPFDESVLLEPDVNYYSKVSKVPGTGVVSFFVSPGDEDWGGLITDSQYNFQYIPDVIYEGYNFVPNVDLFLTISGCMDINACNYSSGATVDAGNCFYPASQYVDCSGECFNDLNNNGVCDELDIEGCTDVLACNYSVGSTIDDGTCTYPAAEYLDCNGDCLNDINYNGICDPSEVFGCTDPLACNFQSEATSNNGSCTYSFDLNIQVFNDLNADGSFDSNAEPTVPFAGYFLINPGNIQAHVTAGGSVYVPNLTPGNYTLTFFNLSNNFVSELSNNSLEVVVPTCTMLEFPMIASDGCFTYFWTEQNFPSTNLHCQDGFFPIFHLLTASESLVDVFVMMNFDPALDFDDSITISSEVESLGGEYSFSIPSPGTMVWQFSQIPINIDTYFGVHILGPGEAFIGQNYSFDYTVSILCDGNSIYESSWTSVMEVSCAYDPNDIQGSPEGYTENHFILADTEMEYRIRFQNTGNAPAYDVVIENQLDLDRFDLSSFYPTGASHAMTAVMEPDGMVKFIFNGIMLPDSSANLQESMGYLTYKIRPVEGIPVGDILNNSAAIYFDSNPPIYTNVSYHEIYSCDEIPIVDEMVTLCNGSPFIYDITYPYLESTDWYMNDEWISNNASVFFSIDFEDYVDIQLVMTNPLCEVSSQWNIDLLEQPSNEIVYDDINQTLTATDGVAWQWYSTGSQLILGATEQTFGLEDEGEYYVVIINANGCNITSEVFTFVGIEEVSNSIVAVYPNPVSGPLVLNVSADLIGSIYTIYDITGRVVEYGKINAAKTTIDFSSQSSGSYIIRVGESNIRFLRD
ncbi:MAG: T9SS type A sorting domain-containing protein [Flavobacteriales bacterium]